MFGLGFFVFLWFFLVDFVFLRGFWFWFFPFPLEFKNSLGNQLRKGPRRLKPTLDVSSLSPGKRTEDSRAPKGTG